MKSRKGTNVFVRRDLKDLIAKVKYYILSSSKAIGLGRRINYSLSHAMRPGLQSAIFGWQNY